MWQTDVSNAWTERNEVPDPTGIATIAVKGAVKVTAGNRMVGPPP
jgi:hypothetical protein